MGALTFPHPPLAAGRLAAQLLNRHSPHEIAEAITVLIDVLDLLGGDPEAEDNGDHEGSDGDDNDQAWLEWATLDAAGKRAGNNTGHNEHGIPLHEDDEDDDPLDSTGAEDDGLPRFRLMGSGPGCALSDPGGGDEGV